MLHLGRGKAPLLLLAGAWQHRFQCLYFDMVSTLSRVWPTQDPPVLRLSVGLQAANMLPRQSLLACTHPTSLQPPASHALPHSAPHR